MKVAYRLTALGLAASAAAFALPAAAQDYYPDPNEDIVITGHYNRGQLPDDVQTASQAVSYADLDLGYEADRQELRRRVSLTARYLCDRLGESDSGNSVVASCRDSATRDALRRVGTVQEHWAPRGTAWVAHTRWHAPYPDEWATRYRDGW